MRIGESFRYLPPVTKNLLIINVIIFVVVQFFPTATLMKFENICALHYFTSPDFNPIQFVTYMFIQVDFFHLLFNMFALYMFGMVIERIFGSKRFIIYYMVCGIGAALIQEGVFAILINDLAQGLPESFSVSEISRLQIGDTYPAIFASQIQGIWEYVNVPVIGASGAVFGILLAFGYLLPKAPLYLFFIPVPVQARWVVIGYGVIELLQGVGGVNTSVAHFAHLGGMLFGLLLILYWRKKGFLHVNNF